jgi:uncharacterized membrane protein YczE
MPLFRLVMALVTYTEKLGVKGIYQTITALLIGLFLGIVYLMASVGVPEVWSGYFWYTLYGLVIGTTAIGIYQTDKNMAKKAADGTLK